ncbi:hypothetical protein OK134_17750 [Prosthecomicrobium hirschii]|nr:hypothetical protein [Prosthecomicrobium hirschii]MCW1841949.1 hypothetical protein [Prosthecomicrobium hirschii]
MATITGMITITITITTMDTITTTIITTTTVSTMPGCGLATAWSMPAPGRPGWRSRVCRRTG